MLARQNMPQNGGLFTAGPAGGAGSVRLNFDYTTGNPIPSQNSNDPTQLFNCGTTPINLSDLVWPPNAFQPCSTMNGAGAVVNGDCVGGTGCGDAFGNFDVGLNAPICNQVNDGLYRNIGASFVMDPLTTPPNTPNSPGRMSVVITTALYGVQLSLFDRSATTPQVDTFTSQYVQIAYMGDIIEVSFHAFGPAPFTNFRLKGTVTLVELPPGPARP
jgi:hypothetical protein